MANGTDKAFMDAIKAFEVSGVGTGAIEAKSLDICATYKSVKPILKGILPFIKLIPVFGGTVATAITVLMAALDAACPGN